MEEDEQEQRRKKVEAGRAKLAHFRQRKTKGDCPHPKKKTAKRKGSAVDAPVQEESPVASEEGGRVAGSDACRSAWCSDTLDGAGAAQECERACEPAVAEPMGPCEDETGGQQRTMGGCPPPAEEQQVQLPAQPVAALELEALRLSLSNMHAARLELTQAHLQKEKDSALAELRDALSSRHAQELALLHSRQQLQLEEVALRYHRETAELKEKLQSEMERNAQMTESLKQDWESERDLCLENLRRELSAQHQSELERLRSQFEKASAEHEAEMEKLSQARSQAERSLQTLRAQYEAALRTPQEAVDDPEPGGQEPLRGRQLQAERDSAGGLQEELRRAKEQIQLLTQELREREAERQVSGEALEGHAEARPTRTPPAAGQRAQSDRQPLTRTFALRELQMRQLHDAQAAQIRALEASLVEQQGRLRQLELGLAGDASPQCSQCGREPAAGPAPADRDQELAAARLREDCALQLQLAQNRFLEQRREITEKFVAEQDAVLREAREEHSRELQLLQDRHQQHVASLTAELQAQHQADTVELRALSEARVTALQTEHAAEIRALESRHASDLESVEAHWRSEVEALGEEHRRALQLLRGDPGGQLRGVTWELENVHWKQDAELQSTESSPGVEPAERAEGLRAHQSEPGSQRTAALPDPEETHGRVGERLLPQKNVENEDQVLQLKEQVLSLSRELEQLRQTRDRENQEGTHLIAMLQSDTDLCHSQRTALQDALRRLLGLFGETLKAAVGLRSRISERVGLCLEDDSPADARPGGQAPPAAPALETWPGADVATLGLDGTLPECADTSSMAEISSHLCESFFMSPESTLECEQPVRRVYRSLGLAVDGLLEMVLDSSRQLEEARQIHARLEKEFSSKSEETAQLVRKHQELLERLEEQNAAQTQLTLDLHKVEGLIEGFKVEKANLQEALGQKEAAERGLVVQLEGQSQQLQQAARQQAELREQNAVLRLQAEAAEAAATAAQQREAALRRELEDVTREHSESRRQSEKDRGALLAQTEVLEAELEEQLARHRACAEQTAELSTLRQQLASLDKHLRGQRHFMDEQAAEWEQEREEFQQEVRRLEERLRQVARPQPGSPPDREVELLQEKLREKSDELDELAIKKELADRQVLIQEEEIKHLEETNANTRRQVLQLQEELEKQTRAVEELQQDREALQEQLKSTSPPTSPPGPEAQLRAVQRALVRRESETSLRTREEETLRESEQVAAGTGSGALSEAVHSRSAEVEELRSIIEALQENQERLQKDRADEVQQLHEVIERLQRELCPRGPAGHEHSAGPAHSLQGQLQCPQAGGAEAQAPLHAELQAALAAPEALSRLLAEQERQHGQALGALQQHLRSAEQAAARQLAQPGPGVGLREAEVQDLASQIREFEATLKAKDTVIAERDAEIAERDAAIEVLNRRTSARRAELEAVRSGLARLRRALERQPPELQRLRAQCVRLSRHLQALSLRFLTCQDGLDRRQTCAAPLAVHGGHGAPGLVSEGEEASCEEEPERDVGSGQLTDTPRVHGGDPQSPGKEGLQPAKALVTLNTADVHRQDSVMSVLTVCQRQLESELFLVKNEMRSSAEARGQGKEPPLEGCKLRKADLITQVKQLQEKLNHLIYSMNFQNIEAEDFKSQQPLAFSHVLENSSSDSCSTGEETDRSPPTFTEITWDLVDVTGTRESWIRSEMPHVSTGENEGLREGARVSLHSGCRALTHSQGPEPLQNALSTMDASWGSPEVVRKDSTLELLPSLPLTPCSAASLLQADQSGLLCSPGGSPAVKGPGWSESPSAADRTPSASHHVQRTSVEKDIENFIITSLDSQEKSRSPPSGLERKSDGREKSDGNGAETLVNRGSGGQAVPAAPRPTSQSAMKEKAVPAERVEVLLQMVCDESRHILALSEHQGPLSALGRGEPIIPLEHFLRGGQSPLEVGPAPQKGEKFQEPSGTCLDSGGEFLQGVQEAFTQEWDEAHLSQRLEKGVQEQGDLQEKSSELLRLSERSSLLSEVQALRAQLRLTHLQNQEKLQQLCAALSSAEARGSRREHRLRRQVELLAYKVEQEKCIASDLQKTLNEEQEKANSVRKLLVVEENAVRALRAELCECKQDNERLLASLHDMQQEVVQLRSMLDGKEQDLRAALQELQSARGEERTLQGRLEQERLQRLQAEGQSAQALGELRTSLEKQRAQNSQLCVALRHEQTAKDNLQKELRIEASRCDALLAQEQGRAAELRRRLEAEQGHALELSEALQHERLLTERLSRRTLAVPRKPKEERARGAELQAALGEAQPHREELKREKERELELQRQRQEHKIQQLQRTARELEAREAARRPPEAAHLHEQQQDLEKIRQQLLGAAELLTGFINQTVDRTINDWTSSNEKAVTSLVRTLEELRSELSASSSPQKKVSAEQQVRLVDVLLKDNDSLRKALSVATREKAGLGRAAARLERTLTQHVLKGCALSRSDRSAWRRDRKVLQSSLGLPDPGLPSPAARAEADASNVKMEKLYLHYLRAESFRKALIYQKKYLLLLIGGFQDSEQETLSMIAHLGVFPSKADKKMTPSRPFTKFRTAVRVVIAISRLRFLVRKWQEVGRKGALVHSRAPRPGFPVPPQQQAPPETSASPPTRDVPASHTRDPMPKASPRRRERSSSSPNSRSERSYTASQDPEHSLTEYIHHLEVIQQRLGGVLPDPISKKSCRQKTKE